MTLHRPSLLLLPALVVLSSSAPAQVHVSGGNRLETSWEEPTGASRVDDWFNSYLSGSSWEAALRIRVSQGIGAPGADSVSLDQRSFALDTGGIRVLAGTFYEQIGRGLTFRAFEQRFVSLARSDRSFNLDRDVDGVRVGVSTRWLDLRAFSGKPAIAPPNGDPTGGGPLVGHRIDPVQTASGDAYLLEGALSLGGSILGAERRSVQLPGEEAPPSQTLRSVRGGFRVPRGTLYAEWADKVWHGRDRPYGHGLYSEVTFNTGMWGASAEYKDYQDFVFLYQDLPTLVRTHQSVLLNSSTHVQKPQDERGVQVEVVGAPSPWTVTTLNLTGAWNEVILGRRVDFRYREVFLEHRSEGGTLHWLVFADWAEDTFKGDRNRWTGGANLEHALSGGLYSAFGDLELQAVETDRGERFTNGFGQIGLSRAGTVSAALRYRWTTRENAFGDRTEWLGGTLDLRLAGAHSLFLFAGARPAGLLCSGGFCTFTPGFEGVELRLLSAL